MSRAGRTRKKNRPVVRALLILAAALIAFRLYLPTLVLNYVNKTLNKIPDYRGHVEDINIHLWRGAYEIIDLKIEKIEGNIPLPFFQVKSADLSIQWKELFHGSVVGKIKLTEPRLNFVMGGSKKNSQTSIDKSWQDRVKELFPLRINYLGVVDGSIHYADTNAVPPVDIHLDRLQVHANNLSNSRRRYNKLVSTVDAQGQPMKHGLFKLHAEFNPFNEMPTFQMGMVLFQFKLQSINPLLHHYAGLKAERGRVNVYVECAAEKGHFKGYVKPFFENMHFANFGNPTLTFSEKVKGVIANIAAWLVKNRQKKSNATKIEFSGKFEDPDIKTWEAVKFAFRHAFVRPLVPRLEHSIVPKKAPVKL